MSRLLFSAGGRVFSSAVMFFALIFVSVGSSVVCGQGLEGAWILMEGSNKGEAVSFLDGGRGNGYYLIRRGCSVSTTVITDASGNEAAGLEGLSDIMRQGSECAEEFTYEKVGTELFIRGVNGKPLSINYVQFQGSSKTYDDKWSFEILEDGKYLKLNGVTLKKVENFEEFRKTKENEKAFESAIRNGAAAYNSKNYDAAIKNITEAIRLNPNAETAYKEIYFIRGNAYFEKKDYERALADFAKAIRLEPDNIGAYYGMAKIYEKRKAYDDAVASYTKILQVNPNVPPVLNSRAWIYAYYLRRDYDQAIADATKAIRLEPDGNYYDTRGWAHLGKWDYSNAISDFSSALRLKPNIVGSYLGRGIAYNENGDYKKAVSDFNKVLKMSDKTEEIKKANEGLERAQSALDAQKESKKKK